MGNFYVPVRGGKNETYFHHDSVRSVGAHYVVNFS